jgi:hypothetical protein
MKIAIHLQSQAVELYLGCLTMRMGYGSALFRKVACQGDLSLKISPSKNVVWWKWISELYTG